MIEKTYDDGLLEGKKKALEEVLERCIDIRNTYGSLELADVVNIVHQMNIE